MTSAFRTFSCWLWRKPEDRKISVAVGLLGVMIAARVLLSLAVVFGTLTAAATPVWAILSSPQGVIAVDELVDGSLQLTNTRPGAILSSSSLSPGHSVSAPVTIGNAGSLRGVLRLAATTEGSAELARQLRLEIVERGLRVYAGPLSHFRAAELGTIAGGAVRRFVFRLSLPTTGSSEQDNALQDLTVDTLFSWSAAQA